MKLLQLEQGSQEWLDLRKMMITGTDMAAILGVSPWRSAYDLWRLKLGLKEPDVLNDAMKRGMDAEEAGRVLAVDEIGVDFTPQVIVSTRNPWLMASLDGLSTCKKIMLEIKTPMPHNYAKSAAGDIPRDYYIQMQTAFAASDGVIEKCYFCIYSPEKNEVSYRVVVRDEDLISEIITESKIFHDRLKNYDPPPPPHLVIENREMRAAWDDYIKYCDDEKQVALLKEEAKARILKLCGSDSVVSFGNKVTRYYQNGFVNYKAIPELKHVDLNAYRAKPAERVRLSIGK